MSIYRYRQFRHALKKTPFNGTFMPYDWGGLPNSLPFNWMAYSEMFNEFSREISNSINDLTRYTHDLAAWNKVIEPLNDDQRLNVAHEFITPLATLALNLPYIIRSRLIFAVTHLCHQANQAKDRKAWKDDLPLDGEIYFAAADKYGAPWKRYSKLKTSLERIGSKNYQDATGNFRNAYNHRFSQRIVLGQTHMVTRYTDSTTGKVSYGFGGRDALTLGTVVCLLEQQCQHNYKAFEHFQNLIAEHESAIVRSIPSLP
jgi:hypothetical protein